MFSMPFIIIQGVVLLMYKNERNVLTFKEALNSAIEKQNVKEEFKGYIKINLALDSYRIKNNKYPESLRDLVPDYLDSIPIDPNTAEPYQYLITEDSFLLGAESVSAKTGREQQQKIEESEEEILLASLNTVQDLQIYDPLGKRDPFRTFDFSKFSKIAAGENPLERNDYHNFRLAAVLLDDETTPKAILEDANEKGHTVTIGSTVGLYGAKVSAIFEDKIILSETTIDFTGESETRFIEISLEVQEEDYGSLTKEESLNLKKESEAIVLKDTKDKQNSNIGKIDLREAPKKSPKNNRKDKKALDKKKALSNKTSKQTANAKSPVIKTEKSIAAERKQKASSATNKNTNKK